MIRINSNELSLCSAIIMWIGIIYYLAFLLIGFAGLPTTIVLLGTSLTTTDPAPIIALSPTMISPITIAPAQILTLLPIRGLRDPLAFRPIVTLCHICTFSPIDSGNIMELNPCCRTIPEPIFSGATTKCTDSLGHGIHSIFARHNTRLRYSRSVAKSFTNDRKSYLYLHTVSVANQLYRSSLCVL